LGVDPDRARSELEAAATPAIALEALAEQPAGRVKPARRLSI
jgi:hypothetical protein